MEVRRQFFIAAISGANVTLSPLGESLPPQFGINAITITTTAATPASGFYSAVAACDTFEVIIRRSTRR